MLYIKIFLFFFPSVCETNELDNQFSRFIAVFNLTWRKPNKVDPRLMRKQGCWGGGRELLSLHPMLKPNAWTKG